MARPSNSTSGKKLLAYRTDCNGLQVQPTSFSAGHVDQHNASAADPVSLKSEGKSSVRPTSPIGTVCTNANRPIIRGSRNLHANGTHFQKLHQLSMPTIVTRPIMPERVALKVPKQMPLQCVFSQQKWTSTCQMHSGKHKHYRSPTIVLQGQRMPQHWVVNQTPVTSSALIPSTAMMQSAIAKELLHNTRMPVSTTSFLAQQSTMNHGDTTSPGAARETTSDMSPSFIPEVNSSSGLYSSVMGTPLPSYVSPSGFISSPSNMDPPFLFCTPASSDTLAEMNHRLPSGTASMDTPPSLDLYNKNPKSISYPTLASCNIQVVPVPMWSTPITNPSKNLMSSRPKPKSTNQNTTQETTHYTSSPLSKFSVYEEDQQDVENKTDDDEDLWDASCNFFEYSKDGGSNLFITWEGRKAYLLNKLRHQNLEVRHCFPTQKANVFNVVFQDHKNARKAFSTQRTLHLRMLPPRKSTLNWFRNPSPKFLVKYETKFRLTVRSGKASSHDIVGDFIMTNFKENKGCYLWADQMKGHRIRVVGAQGYFQLPNGTITYLNSAATRIGQNRPIGWVSYRSKCTRQEFVTRQSGNLLGEYIYKS